jgi:ABC-type transport system involved in multi-copper enzyme maturation permease subunit
MKKLISIAYYTFVENIRNKIFYTIVLFGVIVVGASFLLAALGGEQQKRILLDLGLGAIEFFALVTVIFASVNLILEELQSKTIYLILTRPVSRLAYLLGRYSGLLAAVLCGMLLMALIHLAILFVSHWSFSPRYVLAIVLSFEKIAVIGSMALFFSLFSTSAVSSISFTIFFWILGHFSEEMNFLAGKLNGIVPKIIAKMFYYVSPNLQYFNVKDFWDVPNLYGNWLFISIGYGILYASLMICCSFLLFRHKEF